MTEGSTKSTSILNLVNQTVELPTAPEVLSRLNQVVADPDSTAEDVADVIATDPATATNVLRLVNSAYYGLQVRVSSVSLAVSIIGFNMTKKVALKTSVFQAFGGYEEPHRHFLPQAFWQHSIFTATAARVLGLASKAFADPNAEDLFICGLIHDIGKIIMVERAAADYLPVLEEASRSGRPELDVETEMLGFNHADVGSVLAIKWFLPEDLTIAIRYHHAPDRDPFHQSLSSLIHLADHIAWSAGKPSTRQTTAPDLDSSVYERVGLEPEQVEALLPDIEQAFAETESPF